jgi:hypothetical protein
MPAYSMTYTSLLESVKRWTIRASDADFDAELPRLIDSTERKVARALKTLLNRENVADVLPVGSNFLQKPDRWLETISFRYATGSGSTATSTEIYKREYEYIRKVYPQVANPLPPVYYADFDKDNFFIGPAPDLAYNFQLTFYQRPEPLCTEVSTNFLTEKAPDLMLYGLLLEASPFLENPDTPMWRQFYEQKLAELGVEDDKRKIPESQKPKGTKS